MTSEGRTLRRGLPRTPGGEPWPAVGAVAAGAPTATRREEPNPVVAAVAETVVDASPLVTSEAPAAVATSAPVAVSPGDGPSLRRGLPRTPGGESWPPAATAATAVRVTAPSAVPAMVRHAAPQPSTAVEKTTGPRPPLRLARTVTAGRYAFTRPAPPEAPRRIGPFTRTQWIGAGLIGGFGLLYAAIMAVLAVRWLLSTEPLEAFLEVFPGEYHLPEGAPIGIPTWLAWQHFFNVFLMLLIIRSGIRVRTDQRPSAYWIGRGKRSKKISLTLWFHQSLDILWLVNGVAFVTLLFVTGQWMRVIPTSWEVFPNALSAGLQYVSLDWPTENGWANYNSLQQLAYFTTIFIAAPLAAISGFRMSELWPHKAKGLSRIYPVEWARAVHFPVMLYFVAFIFVHVALVLSTGALRNLNHMFAAQGSVDPNAYAENWTGFWMFFASLVVITAAWVAARPVVLAPIAKLFGTVSAR